VNKILEKNLVPYTTKICKGSSWEHERYIPLLTLIDRLANAQEAAAD